MTARRPLGELIAELAGSAAEFAGAGPLRASSVRIGLPIDLRLVSEAGGLVLIGDVPLFRTRTAFDPDPARVEVEWHAVPPTDGSPAQ